nr:uncharacterized protein LOC112544220 [Pelodiscus sinensis]|eukprot:XP_025035796.1 uncharacterized protein LOC112544220 [Pelodiscus sinensis]
MSTTLAPCSLQTGHYQYQQSHTCPCPCQGIARMVAPTGQYPGGCALPDPIPVNSTYHGCVPCRLGGTYAALSGPGIMVTPRIPTSHKLPGTQGSFQRLSPLRPPNTGNHSTGPYGQHMHCILHQSTGRSQVQDPVCGISAPLELGNSSQCHTHSLLPPRQNQYNCGCTQQILPFPTRMGTPSLRSPQSVPAMGLPRDRPLCYSRQQEMSRLLLKSGHRHPIDGGCLPAQVGNIPSLIRLSSNSTETPSNREDTIRLSDSNPGGPLLASPDMAHATHADVGIQTSTTSMDQQLDLAAKRQSFPSGHRPFAPDSLAPNWLQGLELTCSQAVRDVLVQSRGHSTQRSYLYRWRRFFAWCQSQTIDPLKAHIQCILDYVLHLHSQGLAAASLRVHLAAISAFHAPIEGFFCLLSFTYEEVPQGYFESLPTA